MQMPIESLNLLMLNVGYAEHNADWNWKYVSSPFTRIYYVSEGEAHIRLKATVENCHSSAKTNASIALTSGHLYIIPAHTMHDYECDGKFCHYYLHVYEGFKSESNVFDTYDFPIEVDATDEDIHIFQHLCELYPETCLPASDPTITTTSSPTMCVASTKWNSISACISEAVSLCFSHDSCDMPRHASGQRMSEWHACSTTYMLIYTMT